MNPKDLSLVLVVVALISTSLFALTVFRGRRRAWDWWLVIAAVYCASGLYAFESTRAWAGMSAFAAQIVLLVVPMRAQRASRRAARLGNTSRAVWFARLAVLFHPSRELRGELNSLPLLLALREGEALTDQQLDQLSHGDIFLRKVLDMLVLNVQGKIDELLVNMQDNHARGALIAAGGGALVLRLCVMVDADPSKLRALLAEIEALDPTLKDTDRQALLAVVAMACFATLAETEQSAQALGPYLAPGEPLLLCAFCAWRTGDDARARQYLAQALKENPANAATKHAIHLMTQVIERPRPMAIFGVGAEIEPVVTRLKTNTRALAAIAPLEGRSVGTPWLTYLLTAVLASVHVWLGSRGDPLNPEHLVRSGAVLSLDFVMSHDWWRLLTYGLLHAGVLHLGFNLGALWSFGQFCEAFYGSFRTLIVYVVAGFLGGWAVVYFADPLHPTVLVGASGSIFALGGAMLAALGADRELRNTARGRRELTMLLVLFGAQYLVDRSVPGISSTAHIVGLATGVALGALLTVVKRLTAPRSSSFAQEPTRP